MREITEVIPTEDYRLKIAFDDGERAIVDVKPLMKRKVFQPLKDKSFFRQVEIDHKFGGVQWPNGPDVCIDWIEAEIEALEKQKSTNIELMSGVADEQKIIKKAELISQIADNTHFTKKQTTEFLRSFIEAIHQNLRKNRGIKIADLGTFSVVQRTERVGYSIRTGAKIRIAASKAPRFRASKSLKQAVKKAK